MTDMLKRIWGWIRCQLDLHDQVVVRTHLSYEMSRCSRCGWPNMRDVGGGSSTLKTDNA